MLKITKFNVSHYKNISEAKLDLSSFNVIVGPNNAGKSNFLQVLSFFNHIINGASTDVENGFSYGTFPFPFGIPIIDTSYFLPHTVKIPNLIFTLEFVNTTTNTKYNYSISIAWQTKEKLMGFEGKIAHESFHIKNIHKPGKASLIFERHGNTVSLNDFYKKKINVNSVSPYSSVFKLLNLIPIQKQNPFSEAVDIFESLLKSPIFYFSNTELRKEDDNNRISVFGGRVVGYNLNQEIAELDEPNKKLLLQALKQTLNISNITVKRFDKVSMTPEYYCIVEHANGLKSITDLSDGSLLLIALFVKILSSKESLFLIEEPENSLHPKALMGLLNFIRSFEDEKQFIITTHSIALINTVSPDNVIVARTFEDGTSQLNNIQNAKHLKKQLKKGYLNFSDYIFFDADNETDIEEEVY